MDEQLNQFKEQLEELTEQELAGLICSVYSYNKVQRLFDALAKETLRVKKLYNPINKFIKERGGINITDLTMKFHESCIANKKVEHKSSWVDDLLS